MQPLQKTDRNSISSNVNAPFVPSCIIIRLESQFCLKDNEVETFEKPWGSFKNTYCCSKGISRIPKDSPDDLDENIFEPLDDIKNKIKKDFELSVLCYCF